MLVKYHCKANDCEEHNKQEVIHGFDRLNQDPNELS